MKAHLAKLSLALLSTVFLLGCQEQASSPVEPDGVAPLFRPTCNENPGCSKDKGGGGTKGGDKSTVSVELSGGMVTTGPQLVQLSGPNNAKTLTLGGPASYTMNLVKTRDAGLADFGTNCVSQGEFNGDFKSREKMLAKIVDPIQPRHINVTIDKAADDQESLKNNINSPWREDSESGNLISMSAIAGNGNKEAFALLPGAKGPKVTAVATGDPDVTEYTFAANFGIMWIRQLGFSGLVVCHNRDVVVVTVDLTPTQ